MKKRVAFGGVSIALVAAVFVFVLPRIADYRAVWATVKDLTWQQISLLVLVTLLNLATFAPPFMVALPGLGFLRALTVTLGSTASTYVAPGGAAVGTALSVAMLRAWRFGAQAIALAVTLVGVWNQLFMLGAPAVALTMLTVSGGHDPLLQTVALIGLCVFAIAVAGFAAALSGPEIARAIGDVAARLATWAKSKLHRGPVTWTGHSLVRFRHGAIGLLRRRWWLLTLATTAGQLTVFLVLLACLRTLGVSSAQVTLVEAFAAWTLVRLLGSLPLTPGGIGIVELGLTGALIGFGGANAPVVASVLVYRFLTIVPTLILGTIAGATWRLHRREEPAAP
ncbi:MAG TPA: lysylphosphatidylglycerol synthase domain-containing protein [Gaiellaceae bacterium]